MDADLTAGELEALKRLSSVYVSQYYKSLDNACLSPNIERPKSKDAIAGKMKGLFAILRG